MDEPHAPDLSHLSGEERRQILAVVRRDETLRAQQAAALARLTRDIAALECASLDLPAEHAHTAALCVRCRQPFGYFRFYRTPHCCPKCRFRVCHRCLVGQPDTQAKWLCVLCHKHK